MSDQQGYADKIPKLSPQQFHITQEAGTEPRFTGDLLYNNKAGMYRCVVCETPLFSSETKFDSGSGWPSFSDVVASDKVELIPDYSYGMDRTEVRCKTCGAHLGHVFDAEDYTDTGKYYCINSAALDFADAAKTPQE